MTIGKGIYESEMALFSECMPLCARKGLDTADIVRDAILRQPPTRNPRASAHSIDPARITFVSCIPSHHESTLILQTCYRSMKVALSEQAARNGSDSQAAKT
jgi:hypothetical protein